MSTPILLACLWAVAATIVAFLPMRRQFFPGIALLILAPVLLVWLAVRHDPWIVLVALAGFLSMFRNPLIYLYRRARGLPAVRPSFKEGEK